MTSASESVVFELTDDVLGDYVRNRLELLDELVAHAPDNDWFRWCDKRQLLGRTCNANKQKKSAGTITEEKYFNILRSDAQETLAAEAPVEEIVKTTIQNLVKDELIHRSVRDKFSDHSLKPWRTGVVGTLDDSAELWNKSVVNGLVTYRCYVCFDEFPRADDVVVHLCSHDVYNAPDFKCKKCGISCCSKQNLTCHLASHVITVYTCTTCGDKFVRLRNLRVHMSTVHARTLPCKCHRCACEFNTNAEKQAHVRITHVGRRHQCLACASTFANPTRMFAHMLNAHSSQVHVAAGQCGFTINGQLVTSIAQTEVGQAGGKRTEIRRTEVAQVEVAQMKDRQTEVGHTDVAHTEITPNHSENCELTDDGDDENDIKKRTKVKGKYACAECELNFARRSDWGAHMKHLHAVNTPYQCQLCDDRAYGSFAVLRRHCKSKHASYKIATDGTLTLLGDGRGERPALFRCDFCACNFHENYSWKLHMRDQHCILKPYSCKLCDTMFEKISERTEHVRQHHLETITCELCGFVDDDLFVLNQHRAMHLTRLLRGLPIVAVQRNTFKCGRCAKLLRSSSDIRRHMRNAHALNVAFTCRRCDLEFSTFSEKRAHEKKHGTRQHECDQCGKVFARPGRLAEHRALHTAGTPATRNMDTNFVCDICGKSFARKSTLAWHRRIHTDHFKCPYCDLVVHYASRLREHVASRHPGKSYYSCTACARMFVTADTASQHIDVCAGSSIVEALSTNWSQFVCDVCSKVFASKRFLTAHKKVHLAATKRYTCKECPRVYTSAASLREHENVHLGVRPHICDYCEKSFIYRSGLRIHIKRNHKDPICVN